MAARREPTHFPIGLYVDGQSFAQFEVGNHFLDYWTFFFCFDTARVVATIRLFNKYRRKLVTSSSEDEMWSGPTKSLWIQFSALSVENMSRQKQHARWSHKHCQSWKQNATTSLSSENDDNTRDFIARLSCYWNMIS